MSLATLAQQVVEFHEATLEDTGLSLRVEGDGDPQALPRLFDRFFRGDASRCCDGEKAHHGLGLAIVAAIARSHGGHTVAESRGGVSRVGSTLAAAH